VDRSVDDPIRARIYAVAFYDLRLLLDKKECLNLRSEVKAKIEQVLFNSSFVSDSLEDISRWTKLFLKFGERMKRIAASNGGLGALIVIPSSLLSMWQWVVQRQSSIHKANRCSRWAKRLNEDDFQLAIQHLQSIEVGEIAKEAKAHTVANRIHGHILRSFTGVFEGPGADYDEQMVDVEEEEVEEEVEEEEEKEEEEEDVEDEEMFVEASNNNRSTYSNATSVSTSLNMSDEGFYQRQKCPIYPPPVEGGMGQQMTTNWPVHHPHLAPTVVDPQTNGMYLSPRTSDTKLTEKQMITFRYWTASLKQRT